MDKNNRSKDCQIVKMSDSEFCNLSDSAILSSLHIKYSYTLSEVGFLYLKLYQVMVRRYYQNVMKSIMKRRENRRRRRTRKGRLDAVSINVEKALEKLENEGRKEREKKVCILAWCFVKFVQHFVLKNIESGFKEFQVINEIILDKSRPSSIILDHPKKTV